MSRRSSHKNLTKSNIAIKARQVLDIASDMATDVIRMRDKPGVLDYLSMGTKLTQKVLDKFQGEYYDYFDDWYDMEDLPFADMMIKLIKQFPTEQVGGHDSYAIMISTVHGEEVGWVRQGNSNASAYGGSNETYQGPFIKYERQNETLVALGRMLWDDMGTTKALLGSKDVVKGYTARTTTHLQADRDIDDDVFGSKRARKLYLRARKFIDAGENRSVLLLGPPGTGKTTIMKYVAHELGMYTLRINVNELSSLKPSVIIAAVQLLKPDVLLIDDFDRFNRSSDATILTHLERVNKSVKLFMVSVNDVTEIDPAVVRPGRFDELEEIIRMDREVVERLLVDFDVDDEVKTELMEWPVTYINEFAKRFKVLGAEQAMTESRKLRDRIEKINNVRYEKLGFDDDDDLTEEWVNEAIADLVNENLEGGGQLLDEELLAEIASDMSMRKMSSKRTVKKTVDSNED